VRKRFVGEVTVLAVLLAVLAAGCATSGTPSRPPGQPRTATTHDTHSATVRYVEVAGRKVKMPTELHGAPVEAASSAGEAIVITAGGFEPRQLIAVQGEPVVWTNLTGSVQRVRIDNFAGHPTSPPIQPGATWRYFVRYGGSYVYTSAAGARGTFYAGPDDPNLP